MDCLGVDGLARVRQAAEGWLTAQIPGEIHLDLMRAGQMPDLAVGANMPECRWPETKSWWYRTRFETDADFLQHERQQLVFDGLDLYAQVFVNGQLVGEAANAFVPAVFDGKPFLVEGTNELVVRLTAGSELARHATPPGQGPAPRPNTAADGSMPNPVPEGDPVVEVADAGEGWLHVSSPVYCHAVHVEDHRLRVFTAGAECAKPDHGRERLSDGWLDLLPGVPVRVRRIEGQPSAEVRFEAMTEGAEP